MRKKTRLTERDRFTIRCALRTEYATSMQHLDLMSPWGGILLRAAGQAWDAYQAFTGGEPMHTADAP